MSNRKDLFYDFPPTSDKEWKEKIISDLKGKTFEETLLWRDENDITHKPYYRSSDTENRPIIKEIQSSQANSLGWKSVQVFSNSTEKLKSKIKESLSSGVDEVVIKEVSDAKSTTTLIGDHLKDSAHVHLHLTELANNNIPKNYFTDPIGETLKNGKNKEEDLTALKELFQKRLNQLKPDNFLLVDGSIYKNAGATIVQELAFTLHHAVEYIDLLTNAGYTPEAITRSFTFKLGFGTSYFSEIAKARAARFLIKKIFNLYEVTSEVKIWGEASSYYLTHKDPYSNLLRLSSQCMSAILGNCNLVSLPAYDHWGEHSTLGYRMSKNISLILKNESYFNEVKDLTSGSYYVESLSADFAEEAWKLFLDIEKEGGLMNQLQNGKLIKMINSSKIDRNNTYINKDRTMVGVNKFLNVQETDLSPTIEMGSGLTNAILSKDIKQ